MAPRLCGCIGNISTNTGLATPGRDEQEGGSSGGLVMWGQGLYDCLVLRAG